MRKERDIAELIFDKFRMANCETDSIVMMNTIRFGLIDKLNPKERELFYKVFNGLIYTGYYIYESDSPECIRLTKKGYDYIYDDDKISKMRQQPWVIPSFKDIDWDKAFNELWRIIGPEDTAIHYVKGPVFYNLILEYANDLPPSYSDYIELLRSKDQSTSRVHYYKNLLLHLDIEERKKIYVKIQLLIEDDSNGTITSIDNQETERTIIKPQIDNRYKNRDEEAPTVFISYSWDNKKHEEWILNLATRLCENGVNIILDKWDIESLGQHIPHFMEQSISKSQRVICVMTPNYKKKTDGLSGGVGYEYSIISAEIFARGANTSKFIPIIRLGEDNESIPTAIRGRKYVDMRDDSEFEDKFVNELLRDIHKEPKYKKPNIGKKPTFDN